MSDRTFWERRAKNAEIDFGGPSAYVAGPGREFLLAPGLPSGVVDLLDAGCWRGRHEAVFAASGLTVVGVDIPEAAAAVAVARQRFPSVAFHLVPATTLPLPDKSVRTVLDWRRLHNLTAPGELVAALQESWRVLVKGGRMLVAVRGALANTGELPITKVVSHDGLGGQRADYSLTEEGWRELATASGFDTVHCAEIGEGRCRHGAPSSTTRYLVAHCVKVRNWVRAPRIPTP